MSKREMNKEEKEDWIIAHFVDAYRRLSGSRYSKTERLSPPRPDYLISDDVGNRKEVEVTELYEAPSTITKEQRAKKDEFEQLLEESLRRKQYVGMSIGFAKHKYPANPRQLKDYVKQVADQIEQYVHEKGTTQTWKVKFTTREGQCIDCCFSPDRQSGPSLVFHLFGKNGVTLLDKEAFFEGLKERILD